MEIIQPAIKVALQKNKALCKHGTLAYYCDAEVTAPAKDMHGDLEAALKACVSSPTCFNPRNELSSQAAAFKRNQPQPSVVVVGFALQDIVSNYLASKLTQSARKA
jgi:hypothetical protein